jgi:hypothetical protein
MNLRTLKFAGIVLGLLFLTFARNGIFSASIPLAQGAIAGERTGRWIAEIMETIGCRCGCDLTLTECKRGHLECRTRPEIVAELPATLESGGVSLLQLGGCSCGCGYLLAECGEKHKDCTQRPHIYRQLKFLAVKYGYHAEIPADSDLRPSRVEKRIFTTALQNRIGLLYMHNQGDVEKTEYMQTLRDFQKSRTDSLALIPIDLTAEENRGLLRHYGIEEPSVMMLAPNGAVSALFKGQPPRDHLRRGLVSPKMQEILLAIQRGKTSFLTVGDPDDAAFRKARRISQSAADKLGGIAAAIWVDPGIPAEESLLATLKYDSDGQRTSTFVIAPTGLLVERIESPPTERRLFDSFQKILAMKSGCGRSTVTGGSACQPGYGVSGESSCR